ncbi:LPS export ABC transporter periplasmic protein LptC [Geobacter sp.]|uniref:LPS export ABC transporter periplasmic protein LptC n=1 Tax=Geobacter sp. TaxID=46610 RepID=UPI0026315D0F|nr:LPS export ABC transporter periplasmic protein LptC [Geobacter sp.]
MIKVNKIRHVLAVVIVLVALYLVVSLALNVGTGRKGDKVLPALPRNIELSLKNIHYTETKDGVKKWDLFAEQGEYDKGRDVTRLRGVRFILPGDARSGDITLRADQADYLNASKDVALAGNVVATSVSGMRFSTGHVSYLAARSLITTDDRVRYSDGRFDVEGVGMELSVKSRELRILKDVRAVVRPAAKG